MILLVHGFTFAVGVAVLILLIVAVTAIWESGDRRELHSGSPAPATIVAVRKVGQAAEQVSPPPKKTTHKIERRRR